MNWDDDDDDFSFEDLSPEEKEKLEREMREREERTRNHPLFLKARDIYDTVNAFVESLDKEEREMFAGTLKESAMLLLPKIAGAMSVDSWLLSMQNAAIVRYHAENLMTQTSGLKMFTKADKDYVAVLRQEMEEFKQLFKQWVATFENLNDEDYLDDWGLFFRK